jgi:hypothetical protein
MHSPAACAANTHLFGDFGTMEISTQTAVATVKEKFDFTVDKFPLFGPDNMPTDQYGLFHSKTGYLDGVKSVSPRYVPHTTDDVVALTEAAAEVFDGQISVTCHFNNGHYVHMKPTDGDRRNMFKVTQGDNVFPRFMVRGGFDGTGFKASVGYYRDMCSNLAMLRTVNAFSRSIRHTSGLRDAMDELIETFSQLKESWFTLTDMIAQMQQRTVNMREFLNEIYGEPADDAGGREITMHRNRTTRIMERLWKELGKTGQIQENSDNSSSVPAWFGYNAVQGYEQHDAIRRRMRGDKDFERILRAANSQVLTAEKLALAA